MSSTSSAPSQDAHAVAMRAVNFLFATNEDDFDDALDALEASDDTRTAELIPLLNAFMAGLLEGGVIDKGAAMEKCAAYAVTLRRELDLGWVRA